MFQNIGWGEIFLIVVVGLIIIGPERLPGLITDVRAALFAARKAINNAKKEMDGEFGAEFDEIRKPIAEVAKWRSMGPKAALTHALFDDDEKFLDSFDPKKIMSEDTAGQAYREALARGEEPPTTRAPRDSRASGPKGVSGNAATGAAGNVGDGAGGAAGRGASGAGAARAAGPGSAGAGMHGTAGHAGGAAGAGGAAANDAHGAAGSGGANNTNGSGRPGAAGGAASPNSGRSGLDGGFSWDDIM